MGLGLTVTVIGMSVVFFVLILLYGMMVLVGRLGGGERGPGGRSPVAGARGAPAGAPARPAGEGTRELGPGVALAESNDGPGRCEQVLPGSQLAAVIAAALAASLEPAVGAGISRAGPAVANRGRLSWALSGKIELLTARERLPRG